MVARCSGARRRATFVARARLPMSTAAAADRTRSATQKRICCFEESRRRYGTRARPIVLARAAVARAADTAWHSRRRCQAPGQPGGQRLRARAARDKAQAPSGCYVVVAAAVARGSCAPVRAPFPQCSCAAQWLCPAHSYVRSCNAALQPLLAAAAALGCASVCNDDQRTRYAQQRPLFACLRRRRRSRL